MTFADLALIILVGLLGPGLGSVPRLRAPIVVGEILAGVLLGPSVLDAIHPDTPTATLLSDIGFALLMLILGTHVPVTDRRLRREIPRATIAVAATFGIAVPIAYAISRVVHMHRFLPLSLLLVTSSAAVALPILRDVPIRGETLLRTIAWISVADVFSILVVPLVASGRGSGQVLLGAVLVSLCAVALVLIGHATETAPGAAQVVHRLRKASKKGGWALDLRLALLALFALSALAQHFGTSLLVPGFAVGVAVASLGGPKRLTQQLIGIGEGFFVPLFFVLLGARLNVRQLFHSPRAMLLAILLLAGAVVLHLAMSLALRLPVWSGLLATAQMGVPAAIASLGLAAHWLTGAQAAAILAAALGSLGVAAAGSRLAGSAGPLRDRSRTHVTEDASDEATGGTLNP
jgi:Kef-type K+ transport system membrane component KefB